MKNDTVKQLRGKSYAERYNFFDSLAAKKEPGEKYIDSLDKLNNDKLSSESNLHTALAANIYTPGRFSENSGKESFYVAAVEKSKEKNWKELYALALQQLANYTWVTVTDKNKALQYYNKAYLIYNKLDEKRFPGKFQCLFEYSNAYYSFEDYDRCIKLLTEAVTPGHDERDKGLFLSGCNTLGLCYRSKAEYSKALEIFNEALAFARQNKIDVWSIIIAGNIGTVYHFLNRPDEARPLLEEEVLRGTTGSDWKSAATAKLYLAEIELNAGEITLAKESLHKARNYSLVPKMESSSKFLKRIFDGLALVYRRSGDYHQALLYTDSAKLIDDTIQKKLGGNILLKAQNEIDLASFNEKQETTERINRYTRNGLIAGLILVIITSAILIVRLRIRFIQKQKRTQLEKEKIARELEAATFELNHFARSIEEKNSIIERIERLQTDKQDAEEKYQILSRLEKSVLLTDEQWGEFTGLFEKVHGSFLQRLKEKMPSISPAEARILALGKLKFSNKTMAGMLGITPDAVRMNKHRIRKKLNLEEEAEFEKFLQSV